MTNEELVWAYFKAHAAHDHDRLGELRHPDWVATWPQSGERIRGHANDRAMADAYPGGRPMLGDFRIVGDQDRWVVGPSMTIHRVIGGGEAWWADGTMTYPDGSVWHVAVLLELRDGKVHRETNYFAPSFEPPAWRAPWVELTGA